MIIYFVKKNKLWNNKRKEESEDKMTNGEKIIAILKPRKDQIRIYDNWVEIEIQKLGINFSCELDWWNIECNEPSNKSIIYKAKESKEIQEDLDKLRKLNEPTTKNDLGVDCSLDDFIKYCKRTFGIELTVKKSDNPDTYAKLFGITKNDCTEQNGCISCSLDDGDDCCRKLYEESMQDLTTKNDLEVDCINRQAAITFVCKNIKEILKDTTPLEVKLSDDYIYENVAKIMRNPKVLPSVTPQKPIIDKIRAEIKNLERFEIRGEVTPLVNVDRVLKIIDKVENEVQ